MINTNSFAIESCYSNRVQATPTTNDKLSMSFEESKNEVLNLTKTYITNNEELINENLIIPRHTPIEVREIAKLKEKIAKEKSLPKADTDLINSTPFSQNLNHMLGCRDTTSNYAFVNKIYKELDKIGVLMINLSNYVVVFNPEDSLDEKREVLFALADILKKIDDLDLTPKTKDETFSYYVKKKPLVIFSVKNLGYDITRFEYKNLPLRRNEINTNYIILTAIDLGFDVKLLFSDNTSIAE